MRSLCDITGETAFFFEEKEKQGSGGEERDVLEKGREQKLQLQCIV